jgi:tRNA pseudouridine synthase 10
MSVLLEKARQLLSEGEICDHCLGRAFSQRGSGLRNAERGRALRICICLEDHTLLKPLPGCWVCGGAFEQVERWAHRALEQVRDLEFRTYLMGTRPPLQIEMIEQHLKAKYQLEGEPFKQAFNREVGRRFGELLAAARAPIEVDFRDPEIALLMDLEKDLLEIRINPVFFYGRYQKLSRGIPQTRWPCRECGGHGCEHCGFTGKLYPESVEELIGGPVLAATGGTGTAFHGAGREDIDALMLGTGRPFVLEIKEPKIRTVDLERLGQAINIGAAGKVRVWGLRRVTTAVVERVKNLEAEKAYEARVRFEKPVSLESLRAALSELHCQTIEQRTPQRVAHRRADRVRRRRVLAIEGTMTQPNEALIKMRCEGGLYIKELISGDEGRTQPSLAELLQTHAHVLELSVLDVIGDFPSA